MSEQIPRTNSRRVADLNALDIKLLLKTLTALKNGDFSVRLPSDWGGVNGKIADTLNDVIDINAWLARELERVSLAVCCDGEIAHRADPPRAGGSWAGQIESINALINGLAQPITEMSRVIGAVANGDLSQMMGLEVDGSPLRGEFQRVV